MKSLSICVLVVLLVAMGCTTKYTKPSGQIWAYVGMVDSSGTHGVVYSDDRGACEALRKAEPSNVKTEPCSLAVIWRSGVGSEYWAFSFGRGEVGVAFQQPAFCEFARTNLNKYSPSQCSPITLRFVK